VGPIRGNPGRSPDYSLSRGVIRAPSPIVTVPDSSESGTTTPWRNRMLDFAGINRLIDTDGFLARGKTYES
jgi:hypothetical protein